MLLNLVLNAVLKQMTGQHQGWHERVQDDERHDAESKIMGNEDKGRPIITWRMLVGDKVRNNAMLRGFAE